MAQIVWGDSCLIPPPQTMVRHNQDSWADGYVLVTKSISTRQADWAAEQLATRKCRRGVNFCL
jgi:hypothetical protein